MDGQHHPFARLATAHAANAERDAGVVHDGHVGAAAAAGGVAAKGRRRAGRTDDGVGGKLDRASRHDEIVASLQCIAGENQGAAVAAGTPGGAAAEIDHIASPSPGVVVGAGHAQVGTSPNQVW